MADEISPQQLHTFSTNLLHYRDCLQEYEKPVLNAILNLAWRATAPEDSLFGGFEDSFDPHQAALLVSYDQNYAAIAEATYATVQLRVIKPSPQN
jgi:hypothetical protein